MRGRNIIHIDYHTEDDTPFRVGCVQTVTVQPAIFPDQKGWQLGDLYAQLEQKYGIKVRDNGMSI